MILSWQLVSWCTVSGADPKLYLSWLWAMQYQSAAVDIEQHAPKDLPLDLFLVNCSEMNELLIQTTSALIKQVLSYVERCVGRVHIGLPACLGCGTWCVFGTILEGYVFRGSSPAFD